MTNSNLLKAIIAESDSNCSQLQSLISVIELLRKKVIVIHTNDCLKVIGMTKILLNASFLLLKREKRL